MTKSLRKTSLEEENFVLVPVHGSLALLLFACRESGNIMEGQTELSSSWTLESKANERKGLRFQHPLQRNALRDLFLLHASLLKDSTSPNGTAGR